MEIVKIFFDCVMVWVDWIYNVWCDDVFIYIIGNGGLGIIVSYFVEDFGKGCIVEDCFYDFDFWCFKVFSLIDNFGWIMVVGNDFVYE